MAIEKTVICPAYNEVLNIPSLLAELHNNLDETYEIIVVDDGSTDGTWELALKEAAKYPRVRILRHPQNRGKTDAILTGLEASEGEIIIIYDADLQFAASDIPKLVAKIEEGYDMCVGWKVGKYEKKFVSLIYNFLARKIFSLPVHDINAIKAFRKEVVARLKLRKDWHRYLVPLVWAEGAKITEIPVKLYPRRAGEPKYQSKKRIVIGFFDLIAVAFQLSFMKKPLLYFGSVGAASFLLGFFLGILSIILRILGHGFRPLLYLVILLILTGILLFGLGLLGESFSAIIERLEAIEKKMR
ncbi:MAG: glycosyltransferase family 2 protein [candidate division WOR-3 bacterium]